MSSVVDRKGDTGPIEVRSYAPSGRKLGTAADCYDGSPWELHRGELVEQVGSKDIHGLLMALLAALFRTHARRGVSIMTDIYCDLTDALGPSLRAPDVVIVNDLTEPKDAPYSGVPVLAVEIRGTQSKRYLEEKVKLFLEHDWPLVWILHAEREELEVLRPGSGSVTYRKGTEVPLVPELDKYGLTAVPLEALFDQERASRFNDEWVERAGRKEGREEGREEGRAAARFALRSIFLARGFELDEASSKRIDACSDLSILAGWIARAAVASSAAEALE